MAERNSSITHASRMSSPRAPGPWSTNIEMVDRAASVSGPDRFHAEARRRRVNDDRMLVNPLGDCLQLTISVDHGASNSDYLLQPTTLTMSS